MRIGADVLAGIVEEILRTVVVSERDIGYIRDGLIEADLRGVSTHGVLRLETYVDSWRAGELNPEPKITIRQMGAVGFVDGNHGLGHVVGRESMRVAMELAAQNGVGVVVARESNHTGMLAQHVLPALDAGMVGFFVNNGPAVMAPPGATEAVLSNNPLAYGIPAHEEDPIIFDIACSASSRGKIRTAARRDEAIPEGWASGPDGQPTTDPHLALEGTLLPFGRHKGLGLAIVNECLAGVLSGALLSAEITKNFLAEDATVMHHWGAGHYAMALHLSSFGDPRELRQRVDQLIRTIRSSVPEGIDTDVHIPGHHSARLRRERLRNGIPLTEPIVRSLRRVCEKTSVPWDDARLTVSETVRDRGGR